MNIREFFARNEALEAKGVKVQVTPEGAFIRVRPVKGNEDFQNKLKKLRKPLRAQQAQGKVPDKVWSQITCKAMAGTVLTDWWEEDLKTGERLPVDKYRFFTDEAGKGLAFSVAAAAKQMEDLSEFAEYVATTASDHDVFRDEGDDDAADELEEKNSSSGTAGA